MNIYINLWKTITTKYKTRLLAHKMLIGTDGPTLLWVLLKTYQGTATQVVRITMKELDILKKIFETTHKNNVETFCDHGLKLITTLSNAGGTDTQVFEKCTKH